MVVGNHRKEVIYMPEDYMMEHKNYLIEQYEIARAKLDYGRMQDFAIELYEAYGYIA